MINFTSTLYYLALISTILFVLKLVLFSITGGDSEIETDFNSSVEVDTSFNFLSLQSILSFLMAFGWMGLACINHFNLRLRFVFLISIIFGLLMMYFCAWLMFCTKKLNQRVKRDYSKSVGIVGRAYTDFKPHSKGQIEIVFNGKLSVENAINNTDEEIKAFSEIKIVKYEDKMIYIEQNKGE